MDPMDPMYWLEDEELLRFFHRHKTEISCMEKPHTFLTQLRDHDLVPEDRYKKVSRMKSKDNMKKGIYDILDWLERERAEDIKEFWGSIFKATILNQYPTLQRLRNMLIDGSFNSDTQLPKRAENKESGGGKRKELSEDEEEEETHAKSAKKKRKGRSGSMSCDENVQAGPSSQLRPRKKSNKVCFSSPLKKGEENNIWSWPIYKLQLPVTCGHQAGTLDRQRLAKGDKCIVVGNRWFTPNEFERFAGKKRSKNWKWSIRCRNTTLGKLIQEGHLKVVKYRKGCKRAKRSLFPSSHFATDDNEDEDEECDLEKEDRGSSSSKENSTAATDEEEEEEEQTEQQPEANHDSWRKVFRVTCGDVAGTLHQKRFASGTRGKSIRTETSWMTPLEFMQEASCPPGSRWQKDIKSEEKPLSVLLEAKILMIHSLLCKCTLCKPDREDLEDQKNDDECCVCKSEEEEDELVVCDHCPRSFHQKCHLPDLEDALLGEDKLWMCTFCVFNTTREWLYWEELGRDAVMSLRTINCMLQCQYLLLYLRSEDEEQIFATNPCLHLERYSAVITTPMWLQNVADKLQKQLYQTVGEFVEDIQLIFTNCASYNRNNPEFLAMGNRMKELFDQKFKSVFNITETD